jgi:glycine oxidase
MDRVIVIGGGITGAFVAYFLASHQVPVLVIDHDQAGPAASLVNPGGINPLHGPEIPGRMETFAIHSYQLHRQHWSRIHELSGLDFHGRKISRLAVARSPEDQLLLLENKKLYDRQAGFSAEWLEPGALHALEPLIHQEVIGALLLEGNATVDARMYTKAVTEAAKALGADFIAGQVKTVQASAGGVGIELADGRSYESRQVVLATGPWAPFLTEQLGVTLPIRPVKGQLLLVEFPDTRFKHDITWRTNGLYCHGPGRYWLGGTHEEQGFDQSITGAGRATILATLARILTNGDKCVVIDHQAAFRAVTPDGLPVVGKLSPYDHIFIGSGSGPKGMLLSAGIGRVIAEMIMGQRGPEGMAFLAPDRFNQMGSA